MQCGTCTVEQSDAASNSPETTWYCCQCQEGVSPSWNPVCPCGHNFRSSAGPQAETPLYKPVSAGLCSSQRLSTTVSRYKPDRLRTAIFQPDDEDPETVDPKDLDLTRLSPVADESYSSQHGSISIEKNTSCLDSRTQTEAYTSVDQILGDGSDYSPIASKIHSRERNHGVVFNTSTLEDREKTPTRRTHQPDKQLQAPKSTQLACMFYINKPLKCFNRACSNSRWADIHYLREHLKRVHVYYQCSRCFSGFHTPERLESHENKRSCDRKAPRRLYGISEEKWSKLPKRIRPDGVEKQWTELFRFFFPNKPVPEPFHVSSDEDKFFDDDDGEPSILTSAIARCQDHFKSRLHPYLQEVLRSDMTGISHERRQVLISVVESPDFKHCLHIALSECSDSNTLPTAPYMASEAVFDSATLVHETQHGPVLGSDTDSSSEFNEMWHSGPSATDFHSYENPLDFNWQYTDTHSYYLDGSSTQQTTVPPTSSPYGTDTQIVFSPWVAPSLSASMPSRESFDMTDFLSQPETQESNHLSRSSAISRRPYTESEDTHRMCEALAIEGPPKDYVDGDSINGAFGAALNDSRALQLFGLDVVNDWQGF